MKTTSNKHGIRGQKWEKQNSYCIHQKCYVDTEKSFLDKADSCARKAFRRIILTIWHPLSTNSEHHFWTKNWLCKNWGTKIWHCSFVQIHHFLHCSKRRWGKWAVSLGWKKSVLLALSLTTQDLWNAYEQKYNQMQQKVVLIEFVERRS